MDQPKWGIVTTAKEPTPMLLAFVAHYLHIGASEIHLFLDARDPVFEELIRQKPQVSVTICDEAYWGEHHNGRRPGDHRERQTANAALAYKTTACTWLLHADVDEFLIRHDEIMAFLASRPEDILAVSIVAAERVYLRRAGQKSVLSGLYRKPFDPEDVDGVKAVYGEAARFLVRGLSGHSFNKSFYRVGAGLTLGLHQPRPREVWRKSPKLQIFPRIGLLHFDSYTEAHWVAKMLARIKGGKVGKGRNPGRTALIEQIYEARDDPARLSTLYDATRSLTLRQAARLAVGQKLLPYRFSIKRALAAEWPGLDVDLSHASIDRDLARMRADGVID